MLFAKVSVLVCRDERVKDPDETVQIDLNLSIFLMLEDTISLHVALVMCVHGKSF